MSGVISQSAPASDFGTMYAGKDMMKYLPSKIVLAGAGFVSVPIITRLFDPRAYGNYVLVMTLLRVLTLSTGWLVGLVIRFYPEHEIKNSLTEFRTTLLKTILIWVSGIGLLYATGVCALGGRVDGELRRLLWLGLPLFLLAAAYDTLLEFFRANHRLGLYSTYLTWRTVGTLIIGIAIASAVYRRVEALLFGATTCAIVALPTMWLQAMGHQKIKWRNAICWKLVREMAAYGVPNVISDLSAWALMLSDRYLIGLFRGKLEVGVYSASFSVGEYSISMISSLVGMTSGSIVFNLWEKEGEVQAKAFMAKMTRLYLIVSIPAAMGLSLLAEPVISLITGKQYHEGYRIVPYVVFGALFMGVQQRYHAGIAIVKRNYLLTVSIVLCAITSVSLNLMWIPKYGYRAAGISMLVSNVLLFVCVRCLSRRYIQWEFPVATLARVGISTAIMAANVLWIRGLKPNFAAMTIGLGVSTGAGLYFLCLYLLGEFGGGRLPKASFYGSVLGDSMMRTLSCRRENPDSDLEDAFPPLEAEAENGKDASRIRTIGGSGGR